MRILGFFCEDIRRELARTDSVVGILPDNMNIESPPGLIPKLAVYIRAQIDLDEPPHDIELTLTSAWETRSLGGAKKSLIEQSQKNARDIGLPYAGIVMRSLLVPFEVRAHGVVRVIATVGGVENTCAFLNFRQPPVTSTSSSLPVGQSVSDVPGT